MATDRIGVFMRVTTTTGVVTRQWQNYWVGETVSSYAFAAFDVEGISETSIGDSPEATVALPPDAASFGLVNAAMANGWLFYIDFRRMGNTPGLGTLVRSFVGEALSANGSDEDLSITVGSALSPVTALFPPRVFSTALVCTPPKV